MRSSQSKGGECALFEGEIARSAWVDPDAQLVLEDETGETRVVRLAEQDWRAPSRWEFSESIGVHVALVSTERVEWHEWHDWHPQLALGLAYRFGFLRGFLRVPLELAPPSAGARAGLSGMWSLGPGAAMALEASYGVGGPKWLRPGYFHGPGAGLELTRTGRGFPGGAPNTAMPGVGLRLNYEYRFFEPSQGEPLAVIPYLGLSLFGRGPLKY